MTAVAPAEILTMNAGGRESEAAVTDKPWWKHGMVWLVIGGPAVVVVAGIVTAVIAVRGADAVITDAPAPKPGAAEVRADTPAVQGRNHAATPAR